MHIQCFYISPFLPVLVSISHILSFGILLPTKVHAQPSKPSAKIPILTAHPYGSFLNSQINFLKLLSQYQCLLHYFSLLVYA